MRGIAPFRPPDPASRMAITPVLPFLHLISVRTGMVRQECYYILWLKASYIQDVACKCDFGATATVSQWSDGTRYPCAPAIADPEQHRP